MNVFVMNVIENFKNILKLYFMFYIKGKFTAEVSQLFL